jgi:hypothetical protein
MARDTTTKTELQDEIQNLTNRVMSLQRSLGTVRADLMKIKFPHEHRETMDRVIATVDRIINQA